jgi:aerobic carbon-monoxide dehydrogenase medium subunit
VKPAAFDYVAPRTVPEAVDALTAGHRAKVIAGGQSLILEMHLQRIRPDLVVDINQITGLDQMRVTGATLQVGALVRHRAFETPQAVPGPLGTLFAQAVVNIAHPPIRTRGTMAGSFGWAHPASEWCAIAVALDAHIELHGPHGVRQVAARDFFHGPHQTARLPAEVITALRYRLLGDDTGVAFLEHRRTHFSFAQTAVAAAITVRDGIISQAMIGLANCADRPVRALAAEHVLTGADAGTPVFAHRLPADHPFAHAGRIAADQDAAPFAEPYADLEYRRNTIAVLVTRAVAQAAADQRAHAAAPSGDHQ